MLLTTIKHVQKRSGGGLLGRVAYRRSGGLRCDTTSGLQLRRHGSPEDELTLGYGLENADGKVLAEEREKCRAEQDGEDLLTPMVEKAAEAVAAAAKAGPVMGGTGRPMALCVSLGGAAPAYPQANSDAGAVETYRLGMPTPQDVDARIELSRGTPARRRRTKGKAGAALRPGALKDNLQLILRVRPSSIT